MDRKIGSGLKRGFEMTRKELEEKLKSKQDKLPESYEGLSPEEDLRFQDAMNRIKSAPMPEKTPEQQYLDQMPDSEVDDAFKSALSPEDLIKLKALHKMSTSR